MTSYDIWYIFYLEMSNLFPTISWFVEQCRYRIMTQQNVLRIESLQQHKNLCMKKSFLKLHMKIKDPPNCWNPVDWQQIQVFPVKRMPGKDNLQSGWPSWPQTSIKVYCCEQRCKKRQASYFPLLYLKNPWSVVKEPEKGVQFDRKLCCSVANCCLLIFLPQKSVTRQVIVFN